MTWLANLLLLNTVTLHYFVLAGPETIAYGDHDVSSFENIVRIVSHPKFNRKSKYPSNRKNVWNLRLGTRCLSVSIFCVYLKTTANKQCTTGDILTMKTQNRKMKYCGNKKPSKARPVTISENLSIVWKTDKKKTERGFDCRIKCADRLTTSTITSTTSTANITRPVRCLTSSGPGTDKPCVFPFTWKYTGVTYDGCAFDPTINPAPWCSTLTVDGVHQSGKNEWGYCNSVCPLSSGVTTLAPTTPPPTVAPGIAAGCQCGVPQRSFKIINGEQTEVNEYPWMVGVSRGGALSPLCGGALISDQYVLTAAHCCNNKLVENTQIFLGDHDWTQNSEASSFRRTVSQIKMHPNFGKPKSLNNDVCLLKLTSPISFPDHHNVRPICLPPDASNTYENYKATLTGWGKVAGDGKMSPFLLETEVKILKKTKCKNSFGTSITGQMMCIARTTSPISSACNGDSGGSLIVKNGENFDTVGVVSWGVAGCVDDKPSVMARVTSFLSWIETSTADSNYCPRN